MLGATDIILYIYIYLEADGKCEIIQINDCVCVVCRVYMSRTLRYEATKRHIIIAEIKVRQRQLDKDANGIIS